VSAVIDAEFEAEVRRARPAGVAAVGNVLPGSDLVADHDVVTDVVAIGVAQTVGVLDRDTDAARVAGRRWTWAAASSHRSLAKRAAVRPKSRVT